MVELAMQARCPDCGTSLSDEPWAAGMCLQCLAQLALEDRSALGDSSPPGEAPTLGYSRAYSEDSLAEGQVLGNRYRVSTLLGRGGMGEVWRAFDLKLRVDVALKALRPALLTEERALEALRQEVRSAREVISPNVCRIYQLDELDGRELVSMEYIDGITLADILKMRAPLDLAEAREIASQFLAGLEAIHAADLVHRDMKPENIMMTRSGRVVVMDFGIAKDLTARGTGTVSGTPAYMAPEQARGDSVDARADVFSAGVVLVEMIAPNGIATHEARASIWEGIHHDPPKLPDSPWAPVLKRAVAQRAAQRYPTASTLARALEEVTLRVDGAEKVKPYPGLASFTQEDAEYFFGRELEVEEMWKKLRRPQLLGLIGPSGAGKSSFIRAGLLPVIPTGWRVVVATPENRPFTALGQALVSEFSGDDEAMKQLLNFEDLDVAVSLVTQWHRKHDQVLIVIDQFEELFTQSPSQTQAQFAELLSRLALEADVHILLSMRDDFLFHCQRFEPLKPLFSELTPLGTLSGGALRRALVQPALKCGYKFEDDALVDEMVGEVGQERGALPMLAFAASRLWEKRDRESGLLTREGYESIGGVGGALARHAEQTLEQIGQDHISIVRELFRNLVTAQGTRAARDRDALLSVFAEGEDNLRGKVHDPTRGHVTSTCPPDSAAAVLDTLIDARLLTSYEIEVDEDDEESARHRIEIIHESLLSHWPRLVHWQAQDEEGALLRDQLRQAAQMWEERGKPEDLLWTGTSFKEYELWRERYSGGISSAEEKFAAAMLTKAERNRRRRRLILATVITVLGVGLAIVAGLWRQAELSRQEAEEAALRAEASKLLALGQLELDTFPTGAFAYATKSLELADTPEGRRFALEVLWRGPVARILSVPNYKVGFSPDGSWLAIDYDQVRLASADGELSEPFGSSSGMIASLNGLAFSARSDVFVRSIAKLGADEISMKALERWTLPDLEALPTLRWEQDVAFAPPTAIGLPILQPLSQKPGVFDVSLIPTPPFPYQAPDPEPLGRLELPPNYRYHLLDSSGSQVLFFLDRELFLRRLKLDTPVRERKLGESEKAVRHAAFSPDASLIVTTQQKSEALYVWSTEVEAQNPKLTLDGNKSPDPLSWPKFSPDNSRLVMASSSEASAYLWDLNTPLDGSPLILRKKDGGDGYHGAFHPDGHWLATTHGTDVAFWPVDWPYVRSVDPHEDRGFVWLSDLDFTPDSKWLASCSNASGLHMWPLETGLGGDRTVANGCLALAFDPSGEQILTARNAVWLAPIGATEPDRVLEVGPAWPTEVVFDPTSRYAASAHYPLQPDEETIDLLIWDLESGESRQLDVVENCGVPKTLKDGTLGDDTPGDDTGGDDAQHGECLVNSLGFAADGSLYTAGRTGIRRWDIASGRAEWILGPKPGLIARVDLSPNGRYLLTTTQPRGNSTESFEARWTDLESGTERRLEGFPAAAVTTAVLDPTGQLFAVGTEEGDVWVGKVSGGDPHLLVGHEDGVREIEFSADGQWIASSTSGKIRLWPMPDLDKPPFHALPHEELMAKLHSFTNIHAVEDPTSSTAWSLEVGPFPGWQDVPTW